MRFLTGTGAVALLPSRSLSMSGVFGQYALAAGSSRAGLDRYECEVAHLEPVNQDAPDALNTIPLCRTHHWAYDRRLWAIRPADFRLHVRMAVRHHPSLRALHGGPCAPSTSSCPLPRGADHQCLGNALITPATAAPGGDPGPLSGPAEQAIALLPTRGLSLSCVFGHYELECPGHLRPPNVARTYSGVPNAGEHRDRARAVRHTR